MDRVAIPRLSDCADSCPTDGHSINVPNASEYDAEVSAFARVRVLHAVRALRTQWGPHAEVLDPLYSVLRTCEFGTILEDRALNPWTRAQGFYLMGRLAVRFVGHVVKTCDHHFGEGWTAAMDNLSRLKSKEYHA